MWRAEHVPAAAAIWGDARPVLAAAAAKPVTHRQPDLSVGNYCDTMRPMNPDHDVRANSVSMYFINIVLDVLNTELTQSKPGETVLGNSGYNRLQVAAAAATAAFRKVGHESLHQRITDLTGSSDCSAVTEVRDELLAVITAIPPAE